MAKKFSRDKRFNSAVKKRRGRSYRELRYYNLTMRDLFTPNEATFLMEGIISSPAMKAFRRGINKERYPELQRLLRKHNNDEMKARQELYDLIDERIFESGGKQARKMYEKYGKVKERFGSR